MTGSMWNGRMTPSVAKHRLNTHDVFNHFQVVSIELIDAESDLADMMKDDFSPEDLEELGDGFFTFLVGVSWISGDPNIYYFIYDSEEAQPPVEDIKQAVAEYFKPQPQR